MKTDIAIIGGGLAGVSLADHLQRAGRDYVVIEARNRFGGRIKALDDNNDAFDLGPSWFWPGQPKMAALADRLGLQVFEQYSKGELCSEDERGTVHRGGGYASMEGSLRLEGGMKAVVEGLVQTLEPTRLYPGNPAVELAKNRVTLASGDTVQANHIVVATPPRVAAKIRMVPELSPMQTKALNGVPTWMGGQAKFVATYDTPFWRDAGLSGDATSRRGPMVEIHDASTRSGVTAALFGFVGIPAQHRLDNKAALEAACVEQFGRIFGAQAMKPRLAFLQDWAFAPFSSTPADQVPVGGHPAYRLPAALQSVWDGTLHFGSTEMASEFGGFLEGALVRAHELARALR